MFFNADDSGLTFESKDIHTIEHQLNKDFANLCEWFIDNKLNIHFGQDEKKIYTIWCKTEVGKRWKA